MVRVQTGPPLAPLVLPATVEDINNTRRRRDNHDAPANATGHEEEGAGAASLEGFLGGDVSLVSLCPDDLCWHLRTSLRECRRLQEVIRDNNKDMEKYAKVN